MKKTNQKLLTSISIFVFYFLYGIIFKGNHKWMLLFTLISSFCISYFLFSRIDYKNSLKWYLILVLPFILCFTVFSFFVGLTFVLPYILFVPLSSLFGFRFAVKRGIVLPATAFFLFFIMSFVFFPNMLVYMNNKGARTNKLFKSLTLIDKSRDTIHLNPSKIIALDFWTTSCGVCFEKFPGLERNYLNFKNNKDIELYSINVPMKENNFDATIELVNNLGYKFPTLYATSIEEVQQLGIDAYPHLLVLKNGKIRYDGRLEVDKDIFINNITTEVTRLLNE